ncbi:MAG: site-2 protease family protein [Actinomycetota bacterium]
MLDTLYVGVSLVVGMVAREYARAYAADRCGDPSPRRWGWLSLNPKRWIDPFGSVILPVLILILWAAGYALPPFAYAKHLPLDESNFRQYRRDVVIVSLAGPLANLLLAAAGGVLLRAGVGSFSSELCNYLFLFVFTNLTLCVFHLMPIPGLDGARMLALVMAPRPREVYRNLNQYLILFILAIYFIFGGPMLGIVSVLERALSNLVLGRAHC